MKSLPASTNERFPGLNQDLRSFAALCEQVLTLTSMEMDAIASGSNYQPFDFYHKRKDLLCQLKEALNGLRKWRKSWVETHPAERSQCSELKPLFQVIQGLLMRVLLLDRETQQALLKRGFLPAHQLPSAASRQSHCVADLYRRHSGH